MSDVEEGVLAVVGAMNALANFDKSAFLRIINETDMVPSFMHSTFDHG